MKIVSETGWIKCYDLKGKTQYVKTITERSKSGKTYTRRIAIREKRVA